MGGIPGVFPLHHFVFAFVIISYGSYRLHQKLTFNLKPFTVSSALPEGRGGFAKAKVVVTTLNAFMASTDPTINTSHVPSTRIIKKHHRVEIPEIEKPV